MDGVHSSPEDPPMPPQSFPALPSGKPTAWEETIYAFLVEKRSRSGSTRTVESYARMLWPFFAVTTPDRVRSADVLAYAHGIGSSGRVPSSTTVGARIACLSSFYRFRGKGGKRGRRELPRPAHAAILRTLADAGKDLATMDSGGSLWQAGAGPGGISSGTFYGRFRRYLRAAELR